jgi:ParB family chromosome partitioning protein
MAELTAHRTLALANELAQMPDLALSSVVHNMALQLFYHGEHGSCLNLAVSRTCFTAQGTEVEGSVAGRAVAGRHKAWKAELPTDPDDLWPFVMKLPNERKLALLAHCVSLAIDAVSTSKSIGKEGALSHADALAQAIGLDMTNYWKPTAEGYLSRISKAQILIAVREATSPDQAQTCEAMKKPEMAARAEKLLAGTNWLPEVLR